MSDDDALLAVIQADRNAAAKLPRWPAPSRAKILAGGLDHCDEVQLFARHRLTAPVASMREEWQPIETAPLDGTEIIVLIRPKVIRLGWYFKRSSRTEGWCDENGRDIKPIAWRPMPAIRALSAPEGEG